MMELRIMRMLVLFDLPTGSKSERKSYSRFRGFLVNDGYRMEQYSVYSRILLSRDNVDTHLARLKANLPEAGKVTVLLLTEKQYQNRMVLVDTGGRQKRNNMGAQLTLVF